MKTDLKSSTIIPALPAVTSPVARARRAAFSLVEVMLAVSLLTLVVFALMAVFNSTQQAFRASVTQTDVLEGGRAAMELITTDLRGMTASGGYYNGAVNFSATYAGNNAHNYPIPSLAYQPLIQPMVASSAARTNALQSVFILGRENTKWTGVGYVVVATSQTPLYPLYRFYTETNLSANPLNLYASFSNQIYNAEWTNLSHVMDGVVHFAVRAYDTNGIWLTNGYVTNQAIFSQGIRYFYPVDGEVGCSFFSNSLPPVVELQLGVLEDRTLLRAESRVDVALSYARSNYLAQQSGALHLFRQRVIIPNFDPTAFQ